MTQEKELLLKDLCARLPYEVICTDNRHGDSRIVNIDIEDNTVYYTDFDEYGLIENCKPYLRPMSSMTDEEREEFDKLMNLVEERCINAYGKGGYTLAFTDLNDWLNEHHFDYRGLIDKGLAIAVTEENNPYK